MPGAILLVEDDSGIRDSIAESLVCEGYEVAPVENGQEALAWLERGRTPRLIVVDLVMPVMNGSEFLDRLRRSPPLDRIPVVLMTAAMPSSGMVLPLADSYLPKPFELDELLSVVARYAGPAARA